MVGKNDGGSSGAWTMPLRAAPPPHFVAWHTVLSLSQQPQAPPLPTWWQREQRGGEWLQLTLAVPDCCTRPLVAWPPIIQDATAQLLAASHLKLLVLPPQALQQVARHDGAALVGTPGTRGGGECV